MKLRILLSLALFAIISVHAQTYKFAVICDTRSDATASGRSGVNVSAVKAVCNHLVQDGALFVIAPGDFICGNVNWYPNRPTNDIQLNTFLQAAKSQSVGLPNGDEKVILYPIRGNHECYRNFLSEDSIKASWLRNIGNYLPNTGPSSEKGFTYSFTYANTLFLGLDQYMNADSTQKNGIEVNQAWLNKELAKYPNVKQVFTFGHTPAFAAKHQDCLAEDSLKRNAFIRSINSKSGVYFCGHDHFYARAKIPVYAENGSIQDYMQQVITPSGAPFLTGNSKWNGAYPNKDVVAEKYLNGYLGYQMVTVTDEEVTVKFIATADAGTYSPDSSNYTFNNDWKSWKFEPIDSFSFSLKEQP